MPHQEQNLIHLVQWAVSLKRSAIKYVLGSLVWELLISFYCVTAASPVKNRYIGIIKVDPDSFALRENHAVIIHSCLTVLKTTPSTPEVNEMITERCVSEHIPVPPPCNSPIDFYFFFPRAILIEIYWLNIGKQKEALHWTVPFMALLIQSGHKNVPLCFKEKKLFAIGERLVW